MTILNATEAHSRLYSLIDEATVLAGDLSGAYSRRINIQHRLVYQVYEKERVIKVIIFWMYYE